MLKMILKKSTRRFIRKTVYEKRRGRTKICSPSTQILFLKGLVVEKMITIIR